MDAFSARYGRDIGAISEKCPFLWTRCANINSEGHLTIVDHARPAARIIRHNTTAALVSVDDYNATVNNFPITSSALDAISSKWPTVAPYDRVRPSATWRAEKPTIILP